MKHLAAIGFGYTAAALAKRLKSAGWRVTGSKRTAAGADAVRQQLDAAFVLDDQTPAAQLSPALASATHLLVSAAPGPDGDPLIDRIAQVREHLAQLEWVGYLSTVGVYGNHGGAWVDETTEPQPTSERGRRRLHAEAAWHDFGRRHAIAVQVFRLPGIYGPGRSVFDRLRAGTSRRIIKPGQVFNRMHVDDIAGALEQAVGAPAGTSTTFNLTDDLPGPPQDVIEYAADLMGIEPPPEIAFESADMTPMARSFYGENKRVSNARMKAELGFAPRYPTYREGLAAIWREETLPKDPR